MSVEPQPPGAGRLLSPDAPPHWRAETMGQVKHAFFGRRGGVSTGLYASLNAGTGSRDEPGAVRENRRRIAAAFGAPPERLLGAHQVHSGAAVLVTGPWSGERPHADALVTTTRGLVLSVLSADCAPVLMADAAASVVAAAHAGWKGALAGVLESTLALMQANGAALSRVAAAIGPCIHQASYEVGPEFAARFTETNARFGRFFAPGRSGRLQFDLPGFCADRLQRSGVGRVEVLPLDTCALSEAFFSHRRSAHESAADYGRNCSAIAL